MLAARVLAFLAGFIFVAILSIPAAFIMSVVWLPVCLFADLNPRRRR